MKLSIILAILWPFFSFSQGDSLKVSLDNSITGSYSSAGNMASAELAGDNSISFKKFKISSATNYSASFMDGMKSSELVQKANAGYGSVFLSALYSSSLVRSIKGDVSLGAGYGGKISVSKVEFSASYAALYQKTVYSGGSFSEVSRNSFRLKARHDGELVGFSGEVYYQPSFRNMSDFIVYGSTKLALFPKKRLSFVLQNTVSYISKNSVRMLHSLSFGVGYSFKN